MSLPPALRAETWLGRRNEPHRSKLRGIEWKYGISRLRGKPRGIKPRKGIRAWAPPTVLLAIFISLTSAIALKKSSTWDEPAHMLAGYAYLTEGMDNLSPLNHPAFGRLLTALIPATILDLDLDPGVKPEEDAGSDFHPYALKFLYENRVEGRTILYLGRLANIIVGALLGAYVYAWSRALWGAKGAVLSLLFYALCPNVLANSALATTDMPVTAFFFISAFHLHRLGTRGIGGADAAAAAVAITFALLSKHTALLLAPLMAASFAMSLKRERPLKAISAYVVVCVAVYAGIWAIYGFRFHSAGPYYAPLHWEKFDPLGVDSFFDGMRGLRLLPEAYLYGIEGTFAGASSGKAAFLMGGYSATGWWYYFIVAFLIKTPLPAVVLLIASVLYGLGASGGGRTGDGVRQKVLSVLLPALLVFVAVSAQKVNIGLRHALPAYPFMFTLIGFVPRITTRSMRLARMVFYALCAWYIWAATAISPHQLAYFNELVGGPKNGYRYLVDSNLDWGQDLSGLKTYMVREGIDRIKLAYFGLSDPGYFGIEYDYLPSYIIVNPQNVREDIPLEGHFAISATMLQGVYLQDRDFYRVFREAAPIGNVGYSIFIYRF
jgi:hypothetical protein